jgi:hypothetical protein
MLSDLNSPAIGINSDYKLILLNIKISYSMNNKVKRNQT